MNHDAVVVPAGGPDLTGLAEQMVAKARETGIELTCQDGLLTALTRQVLQSALEEEMAAHLGYGKHDPAGRNWGNSRNGSTPKTVRTEIGDVTIGVPRDRAGTFEPQIVKKHQRRLSGFDEAVIEPEAPAVWCEGPGCEGLESVGNPEWADGARLAAQAQLSAGPSRAVVYPGSERMVGTLTIGAVTELSAIDEVRTMGPSLAPDATLVTRDHVRPLRQDGRWVLHVQPASGGIQVPFEAPANRPCCAEHQ